MMRMALGLLFALVVVAAPLVGVYLIGPALTSAFELDPRLSSLAGVVAAEAVVFAGVFVLARKGR